MVFKEGHFDAEKFIADYEKDTSRKVSDAVCAFLKDATPLIDAAYEVGFKQGKEAVRANEQNSNF